MSWPRACSVVPAGGSHLGLGPPGPGGPRLCVAGSRESACRIWRELEGRPSFPDAGLSVVDLGTGAEVPPAPAAPGLFRVFGSGGPGPPEFEYYWALNRQDACRLWRLRFHSRRGHGDRAIRVQEPQENREAGPVRWRDVPPPAEEAAPPAAPGPGLYRVSSPLADGDRKREGYFAARSRNEACRLWRDLARRQLPPGQDRSEASNTSDRDLLVLRADPVNPAEPVGPVRWEFEAPPAP